MWRSVSVHSDGGRAPREDGASSELPSGAVQAIADVPRGGPPDPARDWAAPSSRVHAPGSGLLAVLEDPVTARPAMSLEDLRRAAELLAPGATIMLRREDVLAAFGTQREPASATLPAPTWREKIWTCPDETRLGVRELAEAMGRPKSWVYRAVSEKQGLHRLPAKRLAGELVFEAGAVRDWLAREESHP